MSLLKKKFAAGAAVVALGGFLGACDDAEETVEDTTEEVTDEVSDENGDAVTAASITDQADQVVASLSEDGNWLTALTADVTVEEDMTVAGTFYDGGEESGDEYRKLALYTQDDERNVTDTFTLTVPMMTVESPNFRIQEGTLDGDVYVDAEGFELANSTVTGDVTFSSQEMMDAAMMDEGTVEGEVSVEE
ncbi:hypothetical protein SAMN04488102_103246 [Alkalibacterium subtropicum]|uniref:Polymer-forming protein n=1 Tax=Alkalibacterium subtropicum TaxID=753702 RepID=A0A1I1H2J7_9LACT|nr:hypothetical protein [Alkalibacterium subtropicum]SFC15663.1 hypothetical protein SAMN04488102_103246 [Alkalibacterium subtropicum]